MSHPSLIVTFTPNPSVDLACEAEAVRPIRKIRVANERFDPGGGGVNVARVVRELGGETLAVVLTGGVTGRFIEELIDAAGVPRRSVEIAGRTRISQVVQDLASGLEYRFVPEGPEIAKAECRDDVVWYTVYLLTTNARVKGYIPAAQQVVLVQRTSIYPL